MSSIVQKENLSTHQLQLLQTELMSRQKSSGTAWLLLIFGGGLGAHRFYLGRTGTAIAMLLTAGALGVWTLVDLFLMGGMIKETNDQIENEIISELRLVENARRNEERLSGGRES
jgi:TM2 domain-containing membrane protein YozV